MLKDHCNNLFHAALECFATVVICHCHHLFQSELVEVYHCENYKTKLHVDDYLILRVHSHHDPDIINQIHFTRFVQRGTPRPVS